MFLIRLLQEGDKEFTGLEHLRAKYCVQEALIVLLAFGELAGERFLSLGGWEGWDNDLRVRSQ